MRIVYVHGIGQQCTKETLKDHYNRSLFGSTSTPCVTRMVYWAAPTDPPLPPDAADDTSGRFSFLKSLHLNGQPKIPRAIASIGTWLGFRKLEVYATKRITSKYIPEVADYLYNEQTRSRFDLKFSKELDFHGPNIVIAHSLGSVIAYHALANISTARVKLFLTVGSPIGLFAFQDAIGPISRPSSVDHWLNIAERTDPVAIDADLTDDGPGIENFCGVGISTTAPEHPHAVEGYLRSAIVRAAVRGAL